MTPHYLLKNKIFACFFFPALCLGVLAFVNPSTVQAESNEIIVEFKEDIVLANNPGTIQKKSFSRASIDPLLAKYRVQHKSIRPVFNQANRGNSSTKRQLAKQSVNGSRELTVAERYPHRAKRALKGLKFDTGGFEKTYVIPLDPNVDPAAAAAEFAKHPNVEYAQPNYKGGVAEIPNDPYYWSKGKAGQQLGDKDYDDMWALKKVNPEPAWDITKGRYVTGPQKGESVIVAVIDSGVDPNHPDIKDNLIPGWNILAGNDNTADVYGHGTKIAGVIAAQGNNFDVSSGKYIGMVGVAPEVKIMPIKVIQDGATFGTQTQYAEAIKYAVDHGADIIHYSVVCAKSDCPANPVVEKQVKYAYDNGVLIIAPADNFNIDILNQSPRNMHLPIVVSAHSEQDVRCGFSNYGLVDVAAPGCSAKANILTLSKGGGYDPAAGTSLSAPFVTGAVALLLAKNPTWSIEQIRQALHTGAVDQDIKGIDTQSGHGLLNVSNALSVTNPPEVIITGTPVKDPETNKDVISASPLISKDVQQMVIYGSANLPTAGNGYSFGGWVLEYGDGNVPGVFTTIASSNAPVVGGVLGTWDVRKVSGGVHALRLRVTINTPSGPKVYIDQKPYKKKYNTAPKLITIKKTGNGLIEPLLTSIKPPETYFQVDAGANQTFTIIPEKGNMLGEVLLDGKVIQAIPSTVIPGAYTISLENVATAQTMTVNFKTGHVIKVLTPEIVVPSGEVVVSTGASKTFTIIAPNNGRVGKVKFLVDGQEVQVTSALASSVGTLSVASEAPLSRSQQEIRKPAMTYYYTFTNVNASHTIAAYIEPLAPGRLIPSMPIPVSNSPTPVPPVNRPPAQRPQTPSVSGN